MSKKNYLSEASLTDIPKKKYVLKLNEGSITSDKIANDSVTSEKIPDDAITTSKIKDSSIVTDKLADRSVTTQKIVEKSITTEKINDDAITSSKIADGNVITSKIANGAVITDKLSDNSVTTSKIKDSNVTTSKINDSAVTTAKIASQNVTTDKIADHAVDNSKLDTDSVTYDKIKDDSIITEKIKDSAVTTEKIEDKAIVNDKMGDSSVDSRVISAGSVQTEHLTNESITTAKVARKSITNDKIADDTLTLDKFDADLRDAIKAATGLPEGLDQKVQDMTENVSKLLDSEFPITLSLSVEGDDNVFSAKVKYTVTSQGEPLVPDTLELRKNDVIVSNSPADSADIDSLIGENREIFSLGVTKEGRTSKQATLIRYVCYYGSSEEATISSEVLETLKKIYVPNASFNPIVNTRDNEYIWLVVPSYLNIDNVMSAGFKVTLDEPQGITTPLGEFKAYRTVEALVEESWDLVIN